MSIVLGVGASHTTLMNTHWDAVAHLDGAVAFRAALAQVNEMIVAAQPDAVVIVGPNHFRGLLARPHARVLDRRRQCRRRG